MSTLKLLFLGIAALTAAGLSGCAGAPPLKPVQVTAPMPGQFYHRIEKGQTLWQISKIYGTDMDEIIRINHISDVSTLEVGQLILIPRNLKTAPHLAAVQPDNEGFIWPMRGRVISYYGSIFDNMTNRGINIKPLSPSDILASRGGRVVFCSPGFSAYGKTVIIDHGDGFLSVYAGNSEVLVKVGDSIQKGTVIGRIGSRSNECLHFEIRKGYIPQNPKFYLP